MTFSRSRNPILADYSRFSQKLTRVKEMIDLLITFNSALDFTFHIEGSVLIALRLLGFIRRSTRGFSYRSPILYLYNSLVLPVLAYGCIIWASDYECHIIKLESAQHKLVQHLSYKICAPMSFVDHNYYCLVDKLQYYDFLFAYKIMHGMINCDELSVLF